MSVVLTELDRDGFAIVPEAISAAEVQALLVAVDELGAGAGDDSRGGLRDLFTTLPLVRDLAKHPAVRRWPAASLGSSCFAVRAILFDKTPDANWKVAWHQDVTIPARRRVDTPGFEGWSEKAGISHVQPPAQILERMLTVRVHLDNCDATNGPVRVLPGSHLDGKLAGAAVDRWKQRADPVETLCSAGGLLLMKPLLLHASSPAQSPAHRRVIHLEYAIDPLPGELDWQERW